MRLIVLLITFSALMAHADDHACLEKAITAHDFNSCNDFCYNQFAERKELAMQCYAVCHDKYDKTPDLKLAGKDDCHLILAPTPEPPAAPVGSPNPVLCNADEPATCDDFFDIEKYANSNPRDLSRAACCLETDNYAPAEKECISSRLGILNQSGDGKDKLDICKCATGPLAAPCAARKSAEEKKKQEDGFTALIAKLTDVQKKKLKSLRVALDVFVKAQGDWIDYTPPGVWPGSARAALDISTRTFLDDQFFKFLRDFEDHPEKVVKAKGKLADANRRLNRVYGKCLQSPREEALMASDDKSVQFFRESERKWIPYRDAWAVYCRARRKPGDKVCSKLVVELTIARAEELEHGCGMNPARH